MSRHVVLGAGPVGRAIVDALVLRGIDVTVVTRSGTQIPGTDAHTCDVRDDVALAKILLGADAVYQCSQPEYHRWQQEFPPLQRSIVSAVQSTDAVLVAVENLYGYGPVTGPITESLPLVATGRKGKTRADMWKSLQSESDAGRLRVTAGRASDFFGPHAEGSQVGDRFFPPLLKNKKAEMFGSLDALHSYTYVGDFGEALVRLALDERSLGKAWHVPNAPAVTHREFVELAAEIAGTKSQYVIRGALAMKLAGLFIPPAREIPEILYEFEEDFIVDHSAYAAVFGDHATPLRESLTTTIDWWRTQSK
jgi:nucleoside-diphosphate-sugar epimerase